MAGARKDPSKPKTHASDPPAGPLAWRRGGAVVAFVLLAGAGLTADLATKHAAFRSLLDDPALAGQVRALTSEHGEKPPADQVLRVLRRQRAVCPGFSLTLSTNPGVVFGLPMPPWAVAIATAGTIALVGAFFATSPAAARWTHVALALILAGAVGNFYDRMLAKVFVPGIDRPITGQVRDFLDFSEIGYPYVFNVADVLLVVGVAMLILYWYVAGRRERKSERPARKTK